MAINNLNPRRTVWFSPNEPSNKYDIWLSRNAHLDENGEPTTDSNSQRGCDYIFKIYDCGKWNPIVGFNTTALNKMNIVKDSPAYTGYEGNSHTDFQEFHLPLFRDPSCSPDELFDAGTVGTVIKDYVSSYDWLAILEGGLGYLIEQYSVDNPFHLEEAKPNKLGGIYANTFASQYTSTGSSGTYLAQAKYKYNASNDYNLYVHAKDIISAVNTYTTDNPSEPGIQPGGDFEWRFATTTQCGGILSATHPVASPAFKPIEVKFYPNVSGYYQNEQHRLCVSAKDVIELINEYYEDNPSAPGIQPSNDFELWLATTNRIGGIKSDVHDSGLTSAFKPVECKFYPDYGNWSSLKERLCINANDVIDSFIESFDSEYPLLLAGAGIEIGLTLDHSQITWAVLGLTTALDGKYARSKINSQNNHIIEWVDSPDTWRPILIGGSSVGENNTLNIVAGLNITITPTINGDVTTATISATSTPSPISYTAGKGIQIDSQNNTISSEILVNNNSYTPLNVALECAGSENNGWIKIDMDNGNTERLLHPFNYIIIGGGTPGINFTFTIPEQLQKYYMKGNPVFIEIDLIKSNTTNTITFGQDSKWIIADGCVQMNNNTGSFKDKHVLVTIQFGIVKIEPIQDYVQQS